MGLIDDASLAFTAALGASKPGTAYSLKPTDGSGDFAFTRADDPNDGGLDLAATFINQQGYIEKGYENFLLQSNFFLTTWQTASLNTPVSGQAGYDGSTDAWLIESQVAFGQLYQNISASGVVSLSLYAKAGTCESVNLTINATLSVTGVFFLTGAGSATASSSQVISVSIERVGTSDWYRCSITYNNSSITRVRIIPSDGSGSAIAGTLFIQDAMLNEGLVAMPYIESGASKAQKGLVQDEPRFTFSNGKRSLLLEPERTNLVAHSEYPQGNQFFNNLIPEYNAAISPEGLLNATKITATGTGAHQYGEYPVVSSGVSVVGSVFVKVYSTQYVQLYFGGGPSSGSPYANFFIGANPSVEREIDLTASIENYGNGWLRLIIKQTTDSGTGGLTFAVMPIPNGTTIRAASYTANGESIFTYGLQLEQNASYPSSYIPTYGTTKTRFQDDMDLNPSAIWDSTGSWTMIFERERTINDSINFINNFQIEGNGSFYLRDRSDSIQLLVIKSGSPTSSAFTNTINQGDTYKIAVKWDGTNMSAFHNGEEITFDNPTTYADSFFRFSINSQHKKRKELYFPTALSHDQCIELTTL